MPPNTVEPSYNIESVPDFGKDGTRPSAPVAQSTGRYMLLITQASLNLIGYLLIGIVVGITLQFAYRFGPNLSTLNLHIVLCVLGFQLLMGVAILTLASESGFAVGISLKHKRWIHSILQVIGSVLALTGCFIMSLSRNVNFNTVHGRFVVLRSSFKMKRIMIFSSFHSSLFMMFSFTEASALAAMVFTVACFFNGIASLYAYEMRKCLPSNLSKLTHILFGIAAFVMATVSLCYGFDKNSFRNWATNEFTDVLFVFMAVFTSICILNPFITFFSKMKNVLRN